MPLYAVKYAICAFLQNMLNMLRSHDRYKPVSLYNIAVAVGWAEVVASGLVTTSSEFPSGELPDWE